MNVHVDPLGRMPLRASLQALPQQADPTPTHDATDLTDGGNLARIVLHGQVYSLRITRAGKLILTK